MLLIKYKFVWLELMMNYLDNYLDSIFTYFKELDIISIYV